MEQAGLTNKDLERVMHSRRGRVSEVLNKRRPLTLDMIRKLNRGMHIPSEVLIQEYALKKRSFKEGKSSLKDHLMRHRLIRTALLLAWVSLSFPHAYAMEDSSDDELAPFTSYISPSDLGLPEIITVDEIPHSCAYCKETLQFKENIHKILSSILPNELILHIFRELSIEDVIIYSTISKSMYNLCQSPVLWENLARRQTVWQPQERLEFIGERNKLSGASLKHGILNHQKPIKGTYWIFKSIVCQPNYYQAILKKKESLKWCIKDQVLTDHLYYSNLFNMSGTNKNTSYWVKASQLQYLLKNPGMIPWDTSLDSVDDFAELTEDKTKPQTHCFSIRKEQFAVYVRDLNTLDISKDIYFSLPKEDTEVVFFSPDANIIIKPLDQEKK